MFKSQQRLYTDIHIATLLFGCSERSVSWNPTIEPDQAQYSAPDTPASRAMKRDYNIAMARGDAKTAKRLYTQLQDQGYLP